MQHQSSDALASTGERSEVRETSTPSSGTQPLGKPELGPSCLACGSSDVIVIGERPDDSQRLNLCCDRCALLQVSPGATADLDARAAQARSKADTVIEPRSARIRAERLALGANVKMGDLVLGFGAYGAQLLGEFHELFGIDAHVVAQTAPAWTPPGAVIFEGEPGAYHPGVTFDAILPLHVAHLWRDPLGTFVHLRKLLKPTGVLILEVQNVLPDGEFDVAAFLGSGTTSSFSLNTIRLVLLRAGFLVEVARDADTIVLSCRPNRAARELPLPFEAAMLQSPEQTGDWLLPRLATYVAAEQMREEVLAGAIDAPHVRAFLELLREPAFDDHLIGAAVEVVQAFAEAGEFTAAQMIAGAALNRAPEGYRAGLERLMAALA
jgi:SAM-dependent methyltransferase